MNIDLSNLPVLSVKIATAIQNALIDAKEREENISEHLGIDNSKNSYPSDRITHYLVKAEMPHQKIKRCTITEVFLLMDENNKAVYYILTENRYKSLIRRPKCHTMKILTQMLQNKRAITTDDFLETSDDYEKQVESVYNKVFSTIPKQYKLYAVTYDKYKAVLLALKLRELDNYLNTIAEKDLSEYITTFATTDDDSVVDAGEGAYTEQPSLLKLKEHKVEKSE